MCKGFLGMGSMLVRSGDHGFDRVDDPECRNAEWRVTSER